MSRSVVVAETDYGEMRGKLSTGEKKKLERKRNTKEACFAVKYDTT